MQLKDIKGYEGRYVVSDDGHIFSLYDFKGAKQFKEKAQCTDKYGYKYVSLYKNRKMKHLTVHRAVASAFLSNEEELPQVNHIDGNKNNNDVSNLEWCTNQYNVQHAYDNGLNVPHKSPWKGCKSKDHPRAKLVMVKKNDVSICFLSARDVNKFLNVSKSCVTQAIKRGNKCKGWKVNWITA